MSESYIFPTLENMGLKSSFCFSKFHRITVFPLSFDTLLFSHDSCNVRFEILYIGF